MIDLGIYYEETFKLIHASATSNISKDKRSTEELEPFQYKVSRLIENILKSGDASAVSNFFRDLNNGNCCGIMEHAKLSSKSPLPVPLIIVQI